MRTAKRKEETKERGQRKTKEGKTGDGCPLFDCRIVIQSRYGGMAKGQ